MNFNIARMTRGAALAGLLGLASAAGAAPTVFQGTDTGGPNCQTMGTCALPGVGSPVTVARNAWLAGSATHAIANLQTEQFKKLPIPTDPQAPNPNLTGTYSIFGGTGTLSGGGSILDNDPTGAPQDPFSTDFAGRWNTTGTDNTWVEFTGYNPNPDFVNCQFDFPPCPERFQSDIVIQLGDNYDAIFFYLTDFGDVTSAGATIEVFLGNNTTNGTGTLINTSDTAKVSFFGLHSDVEFNKITLRVTQNGGVANDGLDQIGLDDLTVADLNRRTVRPLPEPATWVLVGLALAAAGRRARRR